MTDQAAERLALAFVQGCETIAQSIAAVAVALRPSLSPEGCTHPADLRDHSGATMGNLSWTCTVCGYAYIDPRKGGVDGDA